jgi:hypothetical protein
MLPPRMRASSSWYLLVDKGYEWRVGPSVAGGAPLVHALLHCMHSFNAHARSLTDAVRRCGAEEVHGPLPAFCWAYRIARQPPPCLSDGAGLPLHRRAGVPAAARAAVGTLQQRPPTPHAFSNVTFLD